MELLGSQKNAIASLHQTMLVLREELELKNRIIMKLRRKSSTKKRQWSPHKTNSKVNIKIRKCVSFIVNGNNNAVPLIAMDRVLLIAQCNALQ